ncbi:Krr1-domain-containing protein [Gloeophyllum trabeum ATCC 11539]|uniref:Krr1-domain-containing protein n=1 Tax=Gloeophyllum trabeum (strain ATCC 11539 / FP-39264 / Madison 617) TaxID=670483 RepID=S7RQV0_GLOTA|nr:Krr1-domain-containing protein [Gloeophyllum trabeum ATCC 11539]EPQ55289.1 Krr1-domain-containing protein [Gloeophyllum trabeum ATCC 11539]
MLSDSDNEDIHQLTINEHYAKAFEYRKEREELQKLKDKYGSDYEEGDEEEEDSEELESEDEDGEELTPAVDAAILKTLARIKNKDPSIYDPSKPVFDEERQKTQDKSLSSRSKKSKDKSKPLTIRQQALDAVLNPSRSPSRSPSPEVTHVEEQKALRDETVSAFHHAIKDDDDSDILVPREKTQDELEREEEEYREFLQREVGDIRELVMIEPAEEEVRNEKEQEKKMSKKGKKSKENEDQEFLMNYILNRGWIDRTAKRLPTYKEVTDKGKGKAKVKKEESSSETEAEVDDTEDAEFEEVAEQFESSYNFRFEEPDAATIKSYPRQLPGLVRREDSTRKSARERKKERKEQELLQKKEEVKRLKALKMKELRAKLERIGREGGKSVDETKALQQLDLDGEWDPEAHERQMAQIYGDDAPDGDVDAEKPTWDDDIDVRDIAPDLSDEDEQEHEAESSKKSKKKKKKKKDKEREGEVVDGVDVDAMDAERAEYADGDGEEWDGTEEMRKKKLEEYMDSLYEMDFNDMVGGMPTRFKYTKVAPQNFGLSPVEILTATDAELNQFMGIKKLAPYRKGVRWDNQRNEKLRELKTAVAERQQASGFGFASNPGAEGEQRKKKRKGKKERMKLKAASGDVGEDGEEGGEDGETPVPEQAEVRKRKEPDESGDGEGDGVQEGASAKKKRRRHRKAGHGES